MERNTAWELVKQYNKEEFHLRHAITVEQVMGWFAQELGYGDARAHWQVVGLLHDIDFELWPEEHCIKCQSLLKEHGVDDIKPEHEMEKVLFATDELTGLVGAAALMRPSKSVSDMELKSLKKKFKDKKFAAGCSRDVIVQGAEMLGWDIEKLLDMTLRAMQAQERVIESAVAQG